MTLKCKIKEITELKTKEDVEEYPKEEAFDPSQIRVAKDEPKEESEQEEFDSSEDEF